MSSQILSYCYTSHTFHLQTKAIGEELFFNQIDNRNDDDKSASTVPRSIGRGGSFGQPYRESSPSGSLCSGTSGRNTERTLSVTSDRPPRSTHHKKDSYSSLRGGAF
jgi:hypothetical protein